MEGSSTTTPTLPSRDVVSTEGTVTAPRFYEGPLDIHDDVCVHQQYFTYRTDEGLVVGKILSVTFTIDRPAKGVWPLLKDFNIWQNAYNHYYSGVLGDLEGKTFHLGFEPNESGRHQYRVLRVIPEHLIVLSQPVLENDSISSISPDTHVFMLNENGGKTVVTCLMEHAFRAKTEEDGLDHWRKVAQESQMKWRDIFIPTLKRVAYGDMDLGTLASPAA